MPKRFDIKVIIIEEDQDVSIMKFDELIRSLFMFEIAMYNKFEKNSTSAFKMDIEDEDDQVEATDNDNLTESIYVLGKRFNKVMRIID